MVDRIAIKRLSPSDCTLFEAVWRKIDAGNQKSINLNADVLTGEFYPNLTAIAAMTDNEVALAISIYGPDAKGTHKLSRKIIKNPTYKNWRLNGEFISGPPDDHARYDDIKPGDLAIMTFKGEASPSGMDLILISQTDAADVSLHGALQAMFGGKSMIAVTRAQIGAAAISAAVPETHPVYLAAADPETEAMLEDAALGGFEGAAKLLKNAKGRRVSAADLAKAKARADLIGRDGEGLVNAFLAAELAAGKLAGYKWTSDENAVAPFDFDTLTAAGERTLIDAKSTNGPFGNVIHVSLAEVVEASGETPYRIYRIFELGEEGGKLCISDDIGPLAKFLRTTHEANMPAGVRVDSFSIATSVLKWGEEKYVQRPEDENSD